MGVSNLLWNLVVGSQKLHRIIDHEMIGNAYEMHQILSLEQTTSFDPHPAGASDSLDHGQKERIQQLYDLLCHGIRRLLTCAGCLCIGDAGEQRPKLLVVEADLAHLVERAHLIQDWKACERNSLDDPIMGGFEEDLCVAVGFHVEGHGDTFGFGVRRNRAMHEKKRHSETPASRSRISPKWLYQGRRTFASNF